MSGAQDTVTAQPLLTIAIPTYNRAKHIDRQLSWAVNAISDRWDQVELIVSDNGSPDATPEVCQRWVQQTNGRLRAYRQPQNVGLPRNAIFCIQQARGKFIWLVSDDDEICEDTLDWLL
ncbi:MAG: glycosyltransferase, partial [Thermoflexales bacterium]|nr:glycosyltransferase [Thermoflexales bacterium]